MAREMYNFFLESFYLTKKKLSEFKEIIKVVEGGGDCRVLGVGGNDSIWRDLVCDCGSRQSSLPFAQLPLYRLPSGGQKPNLLKYHARCVRYHWGQNDLP